MTLDSPVTDDFGGLRVVCWDWDRIGKDFMGEFTIPTHDLVQFQEESVTKAFPLCDRPDAKKKTKGKCSDLFLDVDERHCCIYSVIIRQ